MNENYEQERGERLPPPSATGLLEGLNPEQREAVLHDEGPLLILAGAGSGKTRVITHRIAYLIRVRGVSPWAILAITFTNKAAAEMKSRIADLVGPVTQSMWIGTFHSMFVRILRRHPVETGYSKSFAIIDTDDQRALVREIMRDLNIDEKLFAVNAVHGAISRAKNRMQSPAAYRSQAGSDFRRRQIAEVYLRYQERLRANDTMDFDDILVETVRLFEGHPEVLAAWQARFRYILVDEYQDTNLAQYRAVNLLAALHRNICVVGDDDQSIYSFRGADIRNILEFEHDYRQTKVIKLERNYRSTGTILAAANAVIAHNGSRKEKNLWTEAGEGEQITFVRAADHFAETRFIAAEIDRYVRDHAGNSWRDVAVLYRVNALSRSIELGLRERGIPYRVYGGLRFYDRREIKDVLAYLRLIQNPGDDLSLARVINVPKRQIGLVTQEAVRSLGQREGLTMLEVCRQAAYFPELRRSAGKLAGFAALIDRLRLDLAASSHTLLEFVEHVLDKSGLMDEILNAKEKNREDSIDRVQNLRELVSDAGEFEDNFTLVGEPEEGATLEVVMAEDGGETLAIRLPEAAETAAEAVDTVAPVIDLATLLEGFLERATLYSAQDLTDENDDHVRLMTIHAAKGLEFPLVFLACVEEGVFPARQSMTSAESLEEERRLAYVAITRAMQRLYITTARTRMLYGYQQEQPVSMFVDEIPKEYLREIGGPAAGVGPAVFGAAGAGAAPRRRTGGEGRTPGFGVSPVSFLERRGAAAPGRATPVRRAVEPDAYRVGGRVSHPIFGRGVIVSVEALAGDVILELDFGGRTKTLLASQANLTLLGN
ncbi:MAG: UvrD-helicase domain-containing protein [Bacillota bacterium]|nr:UvrD-helicase domain-containing protein [Bacillota bacterium]